jgi:sugar-specific transcriptional regulator TrmB
VPSAKNPQKRKRSGPRRSGAGIGDPVAALAELGLTLSEARAFVTLLDGGVMTAAEVAAGAGIPRPKVYEALRLLEEKGFAASSIEGSAARYRGLPPRFAIQGLLRQRDEERRVLKERDAVLGSELIEGLPEPSTDQSSSELYSYMEGIYGRGRTSQALKEIFDSAQSQLLNMTQPPWIQPRRRWNVGEIAALNRGVDVKLLIGQESLGDEERWRSLLDAGGEVRVSEAALPMKLVVCDESAALTSLRDPTTGEQGLSNVLIRQSTIVHSLALLFTEHWEAAKPVAV